MIGVDEVLDNLKQLIEVADARWLEEKTPKGKTFYTEDSDIISQFESEKQKYADETRLAKARAKKVEQEKIVLEKQLEEMSN
jgi:hypothetical protein